MSDHATIAAGWVYPLNPRYGDEVLFENETIRVTKDPGLPGCSGVHVTPLADLANDDPANVYRTIVRTDEVLVAVSGAGQIWLGPPEQFPVLAPGT